jgi:hypothetical protein
VEEVVVVQRGVGGAVPELHPRARATVAGVGVSHHIVPRLWGVADLALGTRGVPAVDGAGEEAAERHAHERGARLEHVRVVTEHDVGHHGAARAAPAAASATALTTKSALIHVFIALPSSELGMKLF